MEFDKKDKPVTPDAKLWNGWKSHGLKPAYEPIIMAMKPNEGSYAENALKWRWKKENKYDGYLLCRNNIKKGGEKKWNN